MKPDSKNVKVRLQQWQIDVLRSVWGQTPLQQIIQTMVDEWVERERADTWSNPVMDLSCSLCIPLQLSGTTEAE